MYWCLYSVFGAFFVRSACVFFMMRILIARIITDTYLRFPCVCIRRYHFFRLEQLQKAAHSKIRCPLPCRLKLAKRHKKTSDWNNNHGAAHAMARLFPCGLCDEPHPRLSLGKCFIRENVMVENRRANAYPPAHAASLVLIPMSLRNSRRSPAITTPMPTTCAEPLGSLVI